MIRCRGTHPTSSVSDIAPHTLKSSRQNIKKYMMIIFNIYQFSEKEIKYITRKCCLK